MTDPKSADTDKQADAPSPPPPHRLASPPEAKPSGMGCGVCAILAGLAIILLGWWLKPDDVRSPRGLLPDYTVLYVETPSLARLKDAGKSYREWAGRYGAEDPAGPLMILEDIATAYLGDPPRGIVGDEEARHPAALALVPSEDGGLVAAAFLDAGSSGNAQKLIERQPVRDALPSSDGMTAGSSTRTDEAGRHLFVVGRWVVLTPSTDFKNFLLGPRPKGMRPLSEIRFALSGRGDLLVALVNPFEYSRLRDDDAPEALPFMAYDEDARATASSEARIELRVIAGPDRSVSFLLRDLGEPVDAAGAAERTWLGWIACVILWCIGIVVGLVALLIVATLLLALYFYLEQWWRGELSPPTPPREAEVSPALREDVEANQAELLREGAKANAETEDSEDDNDTKDESSSKKESSRKKKDDKKEDDTL